MKRDGGDETGWVRQEVYQQDGREKERRYDRGRQG